MSFLDSCRDFVLGGKLPEAQLKLEELLDREPENAEAAKLLGIVYVQTGRGSLAIPRLLLALRKAPHDVEALTWLAAAHQSLGSHQEAIEVLRRILILKQDDSEVFNLLGIGLLAVGKSDEAEAAFRQSLSLMSQSAPAYANLGMALRLQNRGSEALAAFRKAVQLAPEQPQNHLQLFKQLQQLSLMDEAVDCLRLGIKRHPHSVMLAEAMALALGRMKRPEEAERIFRQISKVNASAANSYSAWLQEEGRFEDSVPILQQSLRLIPLQGAPYRSLVEAKVFAIDGKPIRSSVQSLVEDARLDESGRMHLSYTLGKVYEHEGDYRTAMQWFDSANDLAYRVYPNTRTFDPDWTAREPDLMAEIYSADFLHQMKDLGSQGDRPIFIVGMIRSGTTLLDQIVSSHPEITSVGEGTFWNAEGDAIHPRWARERPSFDEITALADRYLRSVRREGITGNFSDKMPLNYRHLGLILSVFSESTDSTYSARSV